MKWGLYVHIPFCQSRCIYCDFYSTVGGSALRRRYVDALCAELRARRPDFPAEPPGTVYIGGGTPSQLSAGELEQLFGAVEACCAPADGAEVTLEANPDDVTPAFAALLARLPVNRVSLGIQTFDDDLLRLLRRRHSAAQARTAVERLHSAGLSNLSIDLIYGLPGQTLKTWDADLDAAFALPVVHLSAYSLMYEDGTPLSRMLKEGRVAEADEELSRAMFGRLMDRCEQEGMEHYEISNFARPGFVSRHNSSYWAGIPYLGIGAAAHSFDGRDRRFNLPDLQAYMASPGNPPHEVETLTEDERADELVMTALRTRRGLSLSDFALRHGEVACRKLLADAAPHLRRGWLVNRDGRIALTRSGLFVSDTVMSDLMRV